MRFYFWIFYRFQIVTHWHRWQHALIRRPVNWRALINWTVHSFTRGNHCWFLIKQQHPAVKISAMRAVMEQLPAALVVAQRKKRANYQPKKFSKRKKKEVGRSLIYTVAISSQLVPSKFNNEIQIFSSDKNATQLAIADYSIRIETREKKCWASPFLHLNRSQCSFPTELA